MSCEICAETFNKRRSCVKCQFCDFEACTACYKTYLVTIPKAGCMSQSCHGEWSRKFLHDKFPHSFLSTTLRDHQKEVLFQSQLALMPETQLFIEEQNWRDDIRIQIFNLTTQKNDLALTLRKTAEIQFKMWNADMYTRLHYLYNSMENRHSDRRKRIDEEMKGLATAGRHGRYNDLIQKQLKECDEFQELVTRLHDLNAILDGGSSTKKERSQFIRKCGDHECRGFLSSRWKCGICEKRTCHDCHEFIKGDDNDHTCNPDMIATAKLLMSDTKGCPKCQTSIFKIDGCDQMWCTQCQTAFSWRTGKIETKIHNPHFYEWQRKNGGLARDPNDVQCGRAMDGFLAIDISKLLDKNVELATRIYDIVRNCIQIIAYDRDAGDILEDNKDLRVRYLVKNLDDTEFKQKLMLLDTRHAKSNEIRNITRLLTNTITDILYRFKDGLVKQDPNCLNIMNEVDAIIEYANGCLRDTKVAFNSASIIQYDSRLNGFRI